MTQLPIRPDTPVGDAVAAVRQWIEVEVPAAWRSAAATGQRRCGRSAGPPITKSGIRPSPNPA